MGRLRKWHFPSTKRQDDRQRVAVTRPPHPGGAAVVERRVEDDLLRAHCCNVLWWKLRPFPKNNIFGKGTQLPPENIATMRTQKVVFNSPFDNGRTARLYNPGTKRIGYAFMTTKPRRIGDAIKTTKPQRINVNPPKESVNVAISCDAFDPGTEGDRGVDQHAGPRRQRVQARVVPGRRDGAPQELADRVQHLLMEESSSPQHEHDRIPSHRPKIVILSPVM
ncbi:hypothetical protein niasHT_033656 [Heterodera trifolii]|uniref:Major sperm protein n=1 Tax=Heterodera trifolii TaxID=157864 RepID=A0ABD2I292_9BILA